MAGTGHSGNGGERVTTNRVQMDERGWPPQPREIVEQSDGRMDLVARAVFQAVDRWIADGTRRPWRTGSATTIRRATPMAA